MIILCLIIDIIIINKIIQYLKNRQITQIQTIENSNKTISTNYTTKKLIMTKTETQFYKLLQNAITENNLNILIFPQINLENIIQAKNNDFAARNRIKSRSIDYTIVSNDTLKVLCCIELDDYTHNTYKRINRDSFINQIFQEVNIKLIRVTVSSSYNIEQIISQIKEVA